jgi:hypothetical protein
MRTKRELEEGFTQGGWTVQETPEQSVETLPLFIVKSTMESTFNR